MSYSLQDVFKQKKKETVSMFKYPIYIVGKKEEKKDSKGMKNSVGRGERHTSVLDSTGTPCFVNYARVLCRFFLKKLSKCLY